MKIFRKEIPHIREDLKLLAALAAAVFVMHVSGIGCPFRFFFGIPCAGCGMSRALLLLLRGHTAEAMAFHPMVVLMPAAGAAWLLRRYIPRGLSRILLLCLGAAFIVTYIFRLINGDPVLGIDLRNGAVCKVIREVYYVLWKLRH